jgi:hypothetical protein
LKIFTIFFAKKFEKHKQQTAAKYKILGVESENFRNLSAEEKQKKNQIKKLRRENSASKKSTTTVR